jgi:hypothetical protein
MLSTGLVAKRRFRQAGFQRNLIVTGMENKQIDRGWLVWRLRSCVGTEYVHRE